MSAMIPLDPWRNVCESLGMMRRVHVQANGGDTQKSAEGCVRACIWRFAGCDTVDINSLS